MSNRLTATVDGEEVEVCGFSQSFWSLALLALLYASNPDALILVRTDDGYRLVKMSELS